MPDNQDDRLVADADPIEFLRQAMQVNPDAAPLRGECPMVDCGGVVVAVSGEVGRCDTCDVEFVWRGQRWLNRPQFGT